MATKTQVKIAVFNVTLGQYVSLRENDYDVDISKHGTKLETWFLYHPKASEIKDLQEMAYHDEQVIELHEVREIVTLDRV